MDITFVNFLNEEINPELLSDANHLNKKGSVIYTKKIADKITSKTQN